MHYLKNEEVISKLNTNDIQGLTSEEVKKRQEEYGLNVLSKRKKKSFIVMFFKQFMDLMIYILFLVALFSILMSSLDGGKSVGDYIDAILIFSIILINALIGSIQEYKAEKSVESIKKLTSPHATVIRDGKETIINTEELVPGDIVLLNAGDIIGADIRLINTNYAQVNESSLTGESVPVEKDASVILKEATLLAERINMAYSGTIITNGTAKGVVVNTGANTEIGHISKLISTEEQRETPLQVEINKLGKRLMFITLGLIALVFIVNVIEHLALMKTMGGTISDVIKEAIMTSVALGVAAIPEGLPAIVTVILSLGMRKLAQKGAIVKSLPAVEALGAVNIICTDKTGTLTVNEMQIKKLLIPEGKTIKEYVIETDKPEGNNKINEMLLFAMLCSDSKLSKTDKGVEKIGDPTELAYFLLAEDLNYDYEETLKNTKVIHKIPFTSETKKMSVFIEYNNKHYIVTKGAFEVLSNNLKDKSLIKGLSEKNEEYANSALRALLLVVKEVNKSFDIKDIDKINDYEFTSLVAMYDPPKLSVKDTILQAAGAGIRTVVLTGDNVVTATAISREVGIFGEGDEAINASLIQNMTEEEFIDTLKKTKVFARVSPEEKLKIIKGYQSLGYTVAMTGDGVNDGPALKVADIGISMGDRGTEVAKDASSLVLTDDNFKTIVTAIEEGRGFYDNIKKAITFLLSCNLGEIVSILLISIILGSKLIPGASTPFSAVQILWVNLVTDSLMALALGFDPKSPDLMKRNPRSKKDSFLAKGNWVRILLLGMVIGATTFTAYSIGYYAFGENIMVAQTFAFMVLAISQLFHAFSIRNNTRSIFGIKVNWVLIGAFIISFILQVSVGVIPVFRDKVFKISSLGVAEWFTILGLSLIPFIVTELSKLFIFTNKKIKDKKASLNA